MVIIQDGCLKNLRFEFGKNIHKKEYGVFTLRGTYH